MKDGFRRGGRSGGDGSDAGEELRDGLARKAAGDKDQARSPVGVRPVFELDWRMSDMLDKMDDDRSAAFSECNDALYAQ